MKKLLRTAAAAACLCLLAACAPARQAGGGEPGAPREDFTSVPSGMQAGGEPEAMAAPVAYRAMWVSYLEWPMFDTSGAQGFAASVGSLLDNCAALGLNTVIVAGAPFRGRGVPQRSVSLEPPCNGRAGAGAPAMTRWPFLWSRPTPAAWPSRHG